jgi:hypothetical protein
MPLGDVDFHADALTERRHCPSFNQLTQRKETSVIRARRLSIGLQLLPLVILALRQRPWRRSRPTRRPSA